MYIRLKKRRNKPGNEYAYAYLVRSRYRKRGSKQKVMAYLGRLYSFNKEKNKEVKISSRMENKGLKQLLRDLIENELYNYGFRKKQRLFVKDDVLVDLGDFTVNKGYCPICIGLNSGYLCDYSLKRLFTENLPNAPTKKAGKELAKRLIDVGVEVNPEIFVLLLKKYGLIKT